MHNLFSFKEQFIHAARAMNAYIYWSELSDSVLFFFLNCEHKTVNKLVDYCAFKNNHFLTRVHIYIDCQELRRW